MSENEIIDLIDEKFGSVLEFAKANPITDFRDLASRINDEVAPVQLEKVLRESCRLAGEEEYFVRSSFIRLFRRYFKRGWRKDSMSSFKLKRFISAWSVGICYLYEVEDIPGAKGFLERLGHVGIPYGWKPESEDDQVLLSLLSLCNLPASFSR